LKFCSWHYVWQLLTSSPFCVLPFHLLLPYTNKKQVKCGIKNFLVKLSYSKVWLLGLGFGNFFIVFELLLCKFNHINKHFLSWLGIIFVYFWANLGSYVVGFDLLTFLSLTSWHATQGLGDSFTIRFFKSNLHDKFSLFENYFALYLQQRCMPLKNIL